MTLIFSSKNDEVYYTQVIDTIKSIQQHGVYTFKEVLDLFCLADCIMDNDTRQKAIHRINTLRGGSFHGRVV